MTSTGESGCGRGALGYVLIEVLVSAAVACAVVGVLLQLAVAAQGSVRREEEAADLHQRLRVAVVSLQRDLLLAGAGSSSGLPSAGPLNDFFPAIVPARIGTIAPDPPLSFFTDRISLMYAAETRSQTRLSAPAAGGESTLVIEGAAPGCPRDGVCGFSSGDRVLIFEPVPARGLYEVFTVTATDSARGLIFAAAPLMGSYAAGARLLVVVQRVYHLDAPGKRLMLYDGYRSDLPLIDHVVDLRFAYYGDASGESVPRPAPGDSNCAYAAGDPPIPLLENFGGIGLKLVTAQRLADGPVCGGGPNRFDTDLLRVRRIAVALRLEAESAEFRGRGAAFFTPGFSRGGERYVPDAAVTFEVTLRNARGQ